MAAHHDCRLAVNDDLTIKCYQRYEDYWKKVRNSEKKELYMDYSIEKNRTVGRFIIDENLLIHYCYHCLKKSLFNKQYLIVKSIEWLMFMEQNELLVANDSCIADVLRGHKLIENSCVGCVIFIIKRFTADGVVIV